MGLLAGPAFCAPPVSGVVRARPQKRRGYHPPRCCNVSSYAAVPLKTVLQEAIAALVPAVAPSSVTVEETTVGPGQLNEHYRLTAGNSGSFLVKVSRRGGMEALRGESLALSLLAEVCENDEELDVHVPLAVASIDSGLRAYSVLPWVDFAPFGSSISSVQKALGAGLARMHMRSVERLRHVHKERFGFPVPTWLGAAAQQNEWSMPGDWVGFFVSQRLRPRLDEAAQKFGHEWGTSNETVLALTTLGDRICNAQALQPLFADCDIAPALVHGDAFMGNTGAHGKSRTACLYDPAFVHRSYFAHDEFDLALGTMWGKFSPAFYEAYREVRGPPQPRFDDRQELYRLYYLLTMLVLHGAGYGSRGNSDDPDGYYERCVRSLVKICALLE